MVFIILPRFNSILVRLKDNYKIKSINAFQRFNSILVRLKVRHVSKSFIEISIGFNSILVRLKD